MKIIYLRQAIKDVNKVKNDKLKSKLLDVINSLKLAENLSEIKNVKKMSGHPDAYRIRIDDYRLGIYYNENKLSIARFTEINEVSIARFVKRNDIYKIFP